MLPLIHLCVSQSQIGSTFVEIRACCQSSLLSKLAERLGQLGNRLVQIRDQAVIGTWKIGRLVL